MTQEKLIEQENILAQAESELYSRSKTLISTHLSLGLSQVQHEKAAIEKLAAIIKKAKTQILKIKKNL